MISIRHFCLIVAAIFALTLCPASPSMGQADEAAQVNRRVIELYQAGRYAEAIPLAQWVLANREKALGADHPDVAAALNNLAALYRAQGRHADAEPLYERALAIREKALGPDHPDVAAALNNLAALYDNEGRYADAEPLFKRALAIVEKALGPDHLYVAAALNNLAALYDDEARYADAEPLYKRALAIRVRALGPDHPDVAAALSNLALLYNNEGRYADAEPLDKRALAIDEKALGPDHPDLSTDVNNLAGLYVAQGRYADAEPLLKRALAIVEKALGPDHPDVAQSLNNLALLYRSQGRYADAEPLFKRALAIFEKSLGPDHPYVATALGNLALLYDKEGRYAHAESLHKHSLAIREKALGPDHPDVAEDLNNLAALYDKEGRYADAEPLYKRALAIDEKALGPDHPLAAPVLNNLASLYHEQKRYGEGLAIVRTAIAHKSAATSAALPVLFGAQAAKLLPAGEALDDGLNVTQRASQTSAGEALNALAVRFSAGNDRLAALVRKDQDLVGEAANLDKAIIAAVSKEPSKRDAAAERNIRDRIAAIAKERDDLGKVLAQDFPDYATLSRPEPLTAQDIQPLLGGDEALVIVHLDIRQSYVWAITRNAAQWLELAVTANEVAKQVSALRDLLDFHTIRPFDARASFALYQQILAPVEDTFGGKPRLSLVLDGALTSLPPQLMVTRDPIGKELKDVDWLIGTHAVTVLPSIASLKVLRGKSAITEASEPLIGFADPIFDPRLQNIRVAANVAASRGFRGTVADIEELRTALRPLPETATELRKVAASVQAEAAALFIGTAATETRVKREKLDQYRIVYFATHGLLAGDVADFAKLNAEPALVLSLPEHPTEFDDGLLTASEVAQLKLNADWVVLSACNTASAEKPGAEALSGLARAFFYAGARSLVVSNWAVDSDSAVVLMTSTFSALAADPKLSHAEALRKSILAMIDNPRRPDWADPKYWAPFVVVGEPAKPAN
jgi:CHAT domain-containing protein/Tfp pilus assembly protein PilF